jgi:hypothetical protein
MSQYPPQGTRPQQANPYAAPAYQAEYAQAPVQQIPPKPQGLWQEGKVLIAANGTPFPDRCVKCNAPANGYRLKRKFSWHHPAIALTIFVAVLVYLILAMVLSKKAVFQLPLCPKHRSMRTWMLITFSLLTIGSIGMIISAIPLENGWVALAGLIFFIGFLITTQYVAQVLTPKKIDDHYAWLKRCSADFLRELPPSR